MDLTSFIDKIKRDGLMSVAPIQMKGEARPVFDMLRIMEDTIAFTPSKDYCQAIGEYYAQAGGHTVIGRELC